METIQIVLEKELLRATNRVVRKRKTNRSAFIREAVREHLRRISEQELDDRERHGYEEHPQTAAELAEIAAWEHEAAWPD